MATYAGRWDCPTCGTRGIYGPETRCPNCGSSRPKDVRFYLPEEAEKINDETKLTAAKAGTDWICGHCQTQNKAIATRCVACDNPRDDSSGDVNLSERVYGTDEVPMGSFAPQRTLHPSEMPRKRKRSPIGGLILTLGLLLGGGYLLLRMFPNQVDVEVTRFSWERQSQLQHLEVVQKEAWSTPSNAFDVQSFRAVRKYNQVLRGYETRTRTVQVKVGTERYVCGKIDKGNGYFVDKYCTRPVYENRQETYQEPIYDRVPVYGTKYRFKVKEWTARESYLIRSSGKDHDPKWPTDARTSQSDWREDTGRRRGRYHVTVRETNGTTHVEEVQYSYWEKLSKGQQIPAKKAFLFGTWYGLAE